jgi:hypothetical protein
MCWGIDDDDDKTMSLFITFSFHFAGLFLPTPFLVSVQMGYFFCQVLSVFWLVYASSPEPSLRLFLANSRSFNLSISLTVKPD